MDKRQLANQRVKYRLLSALIKFKGDKDWPKSARSHDTPLFLDEYDITKLAGGISMAHIYSTVGLQKVTRFRMAQYVIISRNPENDGAAYMERWAQNSGLLAYPGYQPKRIGWNFPFVTEEQSQKFGLRGYVAAYIIPDEFVPACEGADFTYQETDYYATVTITDPFSDPFEKIPGAYQKIFLYLKEHQYELPSYENRACFEFEEVYDNNGVTYMNVYVPVKQERPFYPAN